MDAIQECLQEAQVAMERAHAHIQATLAKVRAGRALPSMLDDIVVLHYGNATPISQVASISAPDARTLAIKPWEPRLTPDLEKAILNSRLALTPQNDGETIRITMPTLTEERRQDLIRQVKAETEKGRIAVRGIRKDAKEALRHLQKSGTSEDAIRAAEGELQKLTDACMSKLDVLLARKEKEIMTV